MTNRGILTRGAAAAACAVLLGAGAAVATPTPRQNCDYARITAWKVYQTCVEAGMAREAKTGLDLPPFARCRHAYFKKWTAFQPKASLAGSTCIGSRFTDNGDGTVTDKLTGLVWEKKTDDSTAHDRHNLYNWSTGTDIEDGPAFTTFLGTVNGACGPGQGVPRVIGHLPEDA